MNEVSHVGDRLERDFRAVESATAGGPTGLQLLGAALLALFLGLALVLAATGLIEDLLNPVRQTAH